MQHVAPTSYSSFGDPIFPPEVFGHIATYADSQSAANIRLTGTWGEDVLFQSCMDLTRTHRLQWEDILTYLRRFYEGVIAGRIPMQHVRVEFYTSGASEGLDAFILEMSPSQDVTYAYWTNDVDFLPIPIPLLREMFNSGRVYVADEYLKEIVRAFYPACLNVVREFNPVPPLNLLATAQTYALLMEWFERVPIGPEELARAKEVSMNIIMRTNSDIRG